MTGKVAAPCKEAQKDLATIETLKIPGYQYYNGAFWSDYLMSPEGKKFRDMAIVLDKVTVWTAMPGSVKDLTKMIDEKNKEIVKFGFNTINSHTKMLQFHIKQHGIDKGSFKALAKMGKEMVALKDDLRKAHDGLASANKVQGAKDAVQAGQAALDKMNKANDAIIEARKKNIAELNKKILEERKKQLKNFETRLLNDTEVDTIDRSVFSQILPMIFQQAGNPEAHVKDFLTFFYREDHRDADKSFSFKVYERTKDQNDLGTYVYLKYYRFKVRRTSERILAFITKDQEQAQAFCASVKYFMPDKVYEQMMSSEKIQESVSAIEALF